MNHLVKLLKTCKDIKAFHLRTVLALKEEANVPWLSITSTSHTHPCLWAVCWHCWWRTDKLKRYLPPRRLTWDSFCLDRHPPALKTLPHKEREQRQADRHAAAHNFSSLFPRRLTAVIQTDSYLRSWRALESAHLGLDPGSCICRPPRTEHWTAPSAHSRPGAKTDGKTEVILAARRCSQKALSHATGEKWSEWLHD